MGVNKVEYNGETLIDLTNDSVTPETLARGVTAHDASGELIEGIMNLTGSIGLEFTERKNTAGNIIAYGVSKGTCTDTEIVIPRYYNGKPVTTINGAAFSGLETVKSIHIPDTVTDIGTLAFSNCINLEKVNIPRSVAWISTGVFRRTNVKSLYIPNSVVEISNDDPFGSVENLYIEHEKAPEGWREGWDEYPRNIMWGVPMSPLVVKSEFDAINGEIENINNALKGKEELKVGSLEGTTWRLNDTIPLDSTITYVIDFVSNGSAYNKLMFTRLGTIAYGSAQNIVYNNGTWSNVNYQYLTFTGGTDLTNLTLIDLLYEIGSLLSVNLSRLQPKYDENLETKSKEIVGAINELKGKIDAGGGSSPNNSLIGTWTVIDEPEIPTGDLPLEFTADGVEYMAIGTTSMGSSSWGINALSYQAKEGGYYVAAYTNNPSGSYGIAHGWGNEANRYITVTKEPDDKNTIKWLGKNTDAPKVEIEEDTFNGFEMPQIRFASAIYTSIGKIVSADNPLKLSVEIVGGGALQEGDKLQICVKRTYGYKKGDPAIPYRKQKLRQMCSYDITAEDLNKRFLTISTDDRVGSWMSYNDRHRQDDDTLSAFYLRIKRVTKYNDDGTECDATFSNIVTVWKTYNPYTNEVNIK
jgi:hypothetical protein